MQLLTPAIREQIRQIVLDAIKRLPPHITPSDPRFLEWLESLIRYHAGHPMDPADEKHPVLGGVGVADKTADLHSAPIEKYMDSGYLRITDTFNIDPVGGYIIGESHLWQNTFTRELYTNYHADPLLWCEPGNIYPYADNGEVPRSYAFEKLDADPEVSEEEKAKLWSKTVNHTRVTKGPGNCSGRLKLYGQAKLGLQIADLLFTDLPGCSAVASTGGTGIYEDDDGDHWLLTFTADVDGEVSGIARRILFEPTHARKVVAYQEETDVEIKLQLLAHLYAAATISTSTETIECSGADLVGLPIAYGWHFNWTGDEASMVCHEYIDPYTTARQYRLDITKPVGGFEALCSLEDEVDWKPSAAAIVYKTKADGGYCAWPGWNQSWSGTYSDAPIYCYYEAVSDSDPTVDSLEVLTMDGYGDFSILTDNMCNANFPRWYEGSTWGLTRYNGAKYGVNIGDFSFVSHSGTVQGIYRLVEDVIQYIVTSSSIATSIVGYEKAGDYCTAGRIIYDGIFCCTGCLNIDIEQEDHYWTLHEIRFTGANSAQAFAIIPPYDCADGIVVMTADGFTNGNATDRSKAFYEGATGNQTITLNSPDGVCDKPSGYVMNNWAGDIGQATGGGNLPTGDYSRVEFKPVYGGRFETVEGETESHEQAEGDPDISACESTWFAITAEDPCIDGIALLAQGVHTPFYGNACEKFYYAGWPEQAGEHSMCALGWA